MYLLLNGIFKLISSQKSYNSDNDLTFYDDLYYGYENEEEKTCALIKGKSLFIKDIRCLDSKDLPYFKYLNLLGGQNKIDYDYSLSIFSLYVFSFSKFLYPS